MINPLFLRRLNDSWAEEYKQRTLLYQGRKFCHENWTGIHEIEIVHINGEKVTIKYLEDGHLESWTLDNLYIFDKEHVELLFNSAEEHRDISEINWKDEKWNFKGIYILHRALSADDRDYYVGQAEHIGWRMLDHNNGSTQKIDQLIASGETFTIRCINLKDSGYLHLDALEAAFIAYLKSFYKFQGYNKTRGMNGPGDTRTGKRIIAINDLEKEETSINQNYSSEKMKEICVEFSKWVEEEVVKNGVIDRKSILCKLDELGI